MRKRLRAAIAAAAVVLCAGVFATVALARFTTDGIVPVFCGQNGSPVYTIAPTTELKVRLGWAVTTQAQATNFLGAQKLTWSVTPEPGGTVTPVSHTPVTEYGDTTGWTTPVNKEITTEKGTKRKIWLTDYLASTGVFVPLGETVRISYNLTANKPTDDGEPGHKVQAFQTITAGNTCTVTGSNS